MGFQWAVIPQSSALLECFEFMDSQGCSAGPRESGWRSGFVKPISTTLQVVCLGPYPQTILHCREEGNNRKLVQAIMGQQTVGSREDSAKNSSFSIGSLAHRGPAPGCQMCTLTYVCHCWSICGSRQRLSFWSWKGDRFITKNRIRSSRAGAWIDKGSSLLAFLSSYLLGPFNIWWRLHS